MLPAHIDGVVAVEAVQVEVGGPAQAAGDVLPGGAHELPDERVVHLAARHVHQRHHLVQQAAAEVDRQVQVGVRVVHDVAVGGAHDLPYALAVLVEHHDGRAALVRRDVVLVAVHLREHQVSPVVVHQGHELAVARGVDLRHLLAEEEGGGQQEYQLNRRKQTTTTTTTAESGPGPVWCAHLVRALVVGVEELRHVAVVVLSHGQPVQVVVVVAHVEAAALVGPHLWTDRGL